MLACFKAYDIRGHVPKELNEDLAWRLGYAIANYLKKPEYIVLGGDIRHSTPSIKHAVSEGVRACGVNVLDIGLCGTEMVYFATCHLKAGGGIMITASHNPKDYNGMKIVAQQAKPLTIETGLKEIYQQILDNKQPQRDTTPITGRYQQRSIMNAYIKHLVTYIDHNIIPLKLIVNAGNGCAGPIVDAIEHYFQEHHIPIQFIKIHHQPDSQFPNGVPNPLLPEKRSETIKALRKHNVDMAIAWDGDFDRCFFFDEQGNFIEGYYIVGLLATMFLKREPGANILHDPRLTWNTIDIAKRYGGTPVMHKTGHAFMKDGMRRTNAIYGGEMSAHHYFRDFFYCDSGMIPWLLVISILSSKKQSLSELVAPMIRRFPASGEINIHLSHPTHAIQHILKQYESKATQIYYTDGISVEFERWRFNLRQSNTEHLVRLNVETYRDTTLLREKTNELLSNIKRLQTKEEDLVNDAHTH